MYPLNKNKLKILVDQYLPHNFLAEKMVLNCLLISSEAITSTIKTLPVEGFYFKNHQEIYKAIIFMYENNMPIDILTIVSFLQDNGYLEKIGGIKVLIELLNQIPNLVYLDEYLRLVKDKYVRRSLIKLGYEIINSSYITNTSLEHILTNIENKLFNISGEIKTQKFFSSGEILNHIFSELKTKFLNPQIIGLPSGFSELDFLTQGFQKSDLIILAGRPSIGKTAFSLNIILNILKNSRLPILFFSLEMSKEQIMYRLLAMETNIDTMRLKTGKLYKNDWLKLNKIIKFLAKLRFFVDDKFDLSVQDIRSKIKTILFEQNQLGLVVIDYIQLMQTVGNKNETRAQELAQITRSLKKIAREFKVPILGLSQLSRNIENRSDKRPILSDLKESGSIEQDADLVLMLYKNPQIAQLSKTNKTSQIVDLIIAKQRNGPTGVAKLRFSEEQTKFLDFD